MHEVKKLGRLTIDLDALVEEAVRHHMEDETDINYPLGRALTELYWDKIEKVHKRMVVLFEQEN